MAASKIGRNPLNPLAVQFAGISGYVSVGLNINALC